MGRSLYPSDKMDQFVVRCPDGLRDRIKARATQNGRSMNAEIVVLLQSGMDGAGAPGIGLRDWFAGQALTGLLASGPHDCSMPELTHDAFNLADAMLRTREEAA